VVLIESPAGAEHQGIFVIRHFRRRVQSIGVKRPWPQVNTVFVQVTGARVIAIGHRPLQAVALDTGSISPRPGRAPVGNLVIPDFLGLLEAQSCPGVWPTP